MKPRIFSRRHVESDMIAIVNHHAIGPDVQVPALGITRDDGIARSDVSAPVERPMFRRRKAEHINIIAGESVGEYRRVL